jgi:hypothetical protein
VGDFRGNGRLDLITTGNNQVSVLLGNGDGTFQPAVDYLAGYGARSVVVADFDGDGKLDVVTANNGEGTVSVLLGNGDGTFAGPKKSFVGDQPWDVAVGDFDGDTKLDVAVTTNYPGYRGLALLYGRGDGSFQAPSYDYLPPGCWGVAADSFRSGRFPDVVVSNASIVSVLLNVENQPAPPPGGSPRRKGPSPVATLLPSGGFSPIAGVDAALEAWPSSPGTPTSLTPSPRAITPGLEVAGLARFFAAAAEQDHGFAWSRSKRDGLLGANVRLLLPADFLRLEYELA